MKLALETEYQSTVNQNSYFYMLFDIETELCLLQLSGEDSVIASLSHRPGYRQITEMTCSLGGNVHRILLQNEPKFKLN